MNRATIVGNLGGDPEIRTTTGGAKVAQFSVATGEKYTDKTTGEKKEITDWHRVVVWNENLVKIVEQYLKKGMRVLVEGRLKTRKWQAQDGSDRYVTEIVLQNFDARILMLGTSTGGVPAPGDDDAPRSGDSTARRATGNAGTRNDDMNDDIPF